MTTKEKQLLDMKVGDNLDEWQNNTDVICVPGGWIFKMIAYNSYIDAAPAITAVFVPMPIAAYSLDEDQATFPTDVGIGSEFNFTRIT